jgi:hypothetical protein
MTIETAAAAAQLNGHAARPTNIDPPHVRTRLAGSLTLALNAIERLDLWQAISDSEGESTVTVTRKALLHALLDHASMGAKLVRLITLNEPSPTRTP